MDTRHRIQAGTWLKALAIGIIAFLFVLDAAYHRAQRPGLFVAHAHYDSDWR